MTALKSFSSAHIKHERLRAVMHNSSPALLGDLQDLVFEILKTFKIIVILKSVMIFKIFRIL